MLYLYNIFLNFDRGSRYVQDPENDNLLGICIYTYNMSLPGYDRVLSGFDIIQILSSLRLFVHTFNVYLEFSGQFCSISRVFLLLLNMGTLTLLTFHLTWQQHSLEASR